MPGICRVVEFSNTSLASSIEDCCFESALPCDCIGLWYRAVRFLGHDARVHESRFRDFVHCQGLPTRRGLYTYLFCSTLWMCAYRVLTFTEDCPLWGWSACISVYPLSSNYQHTWNERLAVNSRELSTVSFIAAVAYVAYPVEKSLLSCFSSLFF